MVLPPSISANGGILPSSQLIKWTLPITLLVSVIGLWWHSRKKKDPPDEKSTSPSSSDVTTDEKKTTSVTTSNGVQKTSTTELRRQPVPATLSSSEIQNSDLNVFIETVRRLNSASTNAVVEGKEILIESVVDSKKAKNLSNGTVVGQCNESSVTSIVTTPTKRSSPQPCTPKTTPCMEELIVASSVKHLNSGSVLNSLEFGVDKSTTKRWSELIEEDSSEEDVLGVGGSRKVDGGDEKPTSRTIDEDLQFQFEEVSSSTVYDEDSCLNCTTDSVVSGGETTDRRQSNDCCDSTIDLTTSSIEQSFSDDASHVIEDSKTHQQQQQYSTKSYSESEANAEVDEIIKTRESTIIGGVDHLTSEQQQRDSANHSPSTDAMLTSPCLSDVHSEGSSDSGKGCSEASRTPAGGSSVSGEVQWCSHQFVMPQNLVGRLIGKGGAFIHRVRSLTHTKIFIKGHPNSYKLKICTVEGTLSDIEAALQLIRKKFPLSEYPFLTLDKVSFLSPDAICCPLRSDPFYLQLIEGINNDVSISSLVSAGHFFVQLQSHPSYLGLEALNETMNQTYGSSLAPLLPAPVENALVAAPAMGGWFRAQIISVDPVSNMCNIRFVDYGGYLSIETSSLRQIRADFLAMPFLAIECALANIVPNTDDGEWTEEARIFVHGLTSGHVLQAQVYDYSCDNQLPLVYLYALHESAVVLVNQELVERGFARLDSQVTTSTPVVIDDSASTPDDVDTTDSTNTITLGTPSDSSSVPVVAT